MRSVNEAFVRPRSAKGFRTADACFLQIGSMTETRGQVSGPSAKEERLIPPPTAAVSNGEWWTFREGPAGSRIFYLYFYPVQMGVRPPGSVLSHVIGLSTLQVRYLF